MLQTHLMTSAGTSKGDISTFILAQDLFAMCGEQMRGTYVAAVHAARTFAGEEAHPVALTKFLGQAVPSLEALTGRHAGSKACFVAGSKCLVIPRSWGRWWCYTGCY